MSVFPTEPAADPLTEWLESLAAVRAHVLDDVLVLPAHNDPFYGLHSRIDNLIQGHEASLSRLFDVLTQPKRALDVFSALFRRPITGAVLQMATGESVAHLNCLIGRNQVARWVDTDGVAWYQVR